MSDHLHEGTFATVRSVTSSESHQQSSWRSYKRRTINKAQLRIVSEMLV